MTLRFRDTMTKTDWMKMTILVAVAAVCWVWVWREYQKPMLTPEYLQDIAAAER